MSTPVTSFRPRGLLAGTRAFLEVSWLRRDLVFLFDAGDSPLGFEALRRQQGHEWISMIYSDARPPDRLHILALTAVIDSGAREAVAARTRRQANQIINAVGHYAERLMPDATAQRPGGRP